MSETVCKTLHVAQPAAPQSIPGYELIERIGSGGYGEVWRALAPGAVQKAVKIVYGNVDESRGATELKSLERIKDARHPFLLVLERYDVVDGRLIVVTELADGSLKDRFDECRAEGKPGIPRRELLEYLRDAADALDYMDEKHGLAHLDIKPENILLVGGRAKVADFGLTKDLKVENLSLMSGLTPLFAGPELFEGRACRQSDQYSLAIVYQILLTGQSPFNGRTAAQLTAQHLHSTPSLSALPPSDRGSIARALSKKPTQRFEKCRAMIDELLDRSSQRRDTAKPNRPASRVDPTPAVEDVSSQISARFGSAPAPATRDRFRPAVDLAHETHDGPAIVIGIGGIGARVLRALAARPTVVDRPRTRLLYVDTDTQDVNQVLREQMSRPARPRLDEPDDGLQIASRATLRDRIDTLAIPLRSASEYRSQATKWLEWIDRRWLYNVPRSLRTEGIRALGRLAFVDRERRLVERLGETWASLLAEVHAGAGADPLPAATTTTVPVVYVVASSSGGTGGGTAVDIARLARRTARGAGIEIDVRAVFVHARRQNTVNGDLADANTLALLSELRHDLARRQDESTNGEAPELGFARVLLIDAGDGICDDDVDSALHTAATFLERAVTSPIGPLLERDAEGTAAAGPTIGSVGFAPVHGTSAERIDGLAGRLERDLLVAWRAAVTEEQRLASSTAANELLECGELTVPQLVDGLSQLGNGEAARQFSEGVAALATVRGVSGDPVAIRALAEEVANAGVKGPQVDERHPGFLLHVIGRDRLQKGERAVAQLSRVVNESLNRPGRRFGEPRALLAMIRTALEASGRALDSAIRAAESALSPARAPGEVSAAVDGRPAHETAVTARFRLAVATIFIESLGGILARVDEIEASIESMQSTLQARIATGVVEGEAIHARLTAELDRRLDRALDDRGLVFAKACTRQADDLHDLLAREARRLASECMLNGAIRAAGESGLKDLVNRTFAAAQPRIRIKGTTRLVLTVPAASLGPVLSPPADRGIVPVVDVDPDAQPGVLWITTGIPFAHVAERFVADRPSVLQLADRLHTRNDVDWRPETRG